MCRLMTKQSRAPYIGEKGRKNLGFLLLSLARDERTYAILDDDADR